MQSVAVSCELCLASHDLWAKRCHAFLGFHVLAPNALSAIHSIRYVTAGRLTCRSCCTPSYDSQICRKKLVWLCCRYDSPVWSRYLRPSSCPAHDKWDIPLAALQWQQCEPFSSR